MLNKITVSSMNGQVKPFIAGWFIKRTFKWMVDEQTFRLYNPSSVSGSSFHLIHWRRVIYPKCLFFFLKKNWPFLIHIFLWNWSPHQLTFKSRDKILSCHCLNENSLTEWTFARHYSFLWINRKKFEICIIFLFIDHY